MFEPLKMDVASRERRRSSRVRATSKSLSQTPERDSPTTPLVSYGTPLLAEKSITIHDNTPPTKRTLRKRKASNGPTFDPVEEAMKPLTEQERRNWKGWVELESDPALFSYILRSYGVKDVKIQEVFSLDLLSELPKPVYGLIFLFKYRDDDAEEIEGLPRCPKNVWFANQTTDNACATVALLNIVMNVPDIEIGETLDAFKESTRRLKPAYRGLRLSCNEFIRGIHNSFVRRMDILNADLALQNEFEKWEKSKKNTRKKALPNKHLPKGKKKKKKKIEDEEEPGYHFIGYVPINGVVWRLDGLQRQPINIGAGGDDWMAVARDNILQRIAQYEDDGIEYSLMSMCKSSLRTLQQELAQSFKSILTVEQRLAIIPKEWKLFMEADESTSRTEFDESYRISKGLIDNATLSESVTRTIDDASGDVLMSLYKSLAKERSKLQVSYAEEVASIEQENEQAARRKHDYTPMLYNSIKALAEAGKLKAIIQDIRGD